MCRSGVALNRGVNGELSRHEDYGGLPWVNPGRKAADSVIASAAFGWISYGRVPALIGSASTRTV